MKYKEYKHCLLKPKTHKALKMLKVIYDFKSIDETIEILMDYFKKNRKLPL